MVGAGRFELPTSQSRTERSTKLSHAPLSTMLVYHNALCPYNTKDSRDVGHNMPIPGRTPTEGFMQRIDLFGRILGILVFLAGIAILVVVFVMAYHFFTSPNSQIQIASQPNSQQAPTTQLGASALRMLARILALIVMAIAGSLIASKGMHLYFQASGRSASPTPPASEP